MVDSEDITLEKIKIQELSLEINYLSNTFQQNTTIQDSPSEPPQIQAVDPNNKSKPQFKKYCSFCHKNNHSVSSCFRRLNMLKESKPQSRSPTPSFYQHFKTPLINLKILATVVEVIVILTVDLLVTLDIDLVLTRARILVLDIRINLTLITILLITTVIDLDMKNIVTKTPTNHTLLLDVHIIILPLLVVHLNFILVLVNVLQVIITPPLNDTTLLIALLPNHVTIAIVVDHIRIRRTTLNFNINPIFISLTHLHHLFKVILLQNPNLKLICTNPLLLLHNTPHSYTLTLLHLQLGLFIYIFLHSVKILRALPNWNSYFYSIGVHLSVF